MDGTLLMRGAGIRVGAQLTSARLIDLLPTILYLMDVPLLNDFDGRVLTEAFTEATIRAHSITYAAHETETFESENVYSHQESEEINERLRALGYLG